MDESIYRPSMGHRNLKNERHIHEGMVLFGIMESGGMMGYIAESFSIWKSRKQIQALKRRHANSHFLQEAGARNSGVGKKYIWQLAWQH